MKQKRIEEIVCLIGIALIAIWVGILCFYHLGEAGTHNTDEARHIANAYEMFKNQNLWRDFLNFPYFTGFPAP